MGTMPRTCVVADITPDTDTRDLTPEAMVAESADTPRIFVAADITPGTDTRDLTPEAMSAESAGADLLGPGTTEVEDPMLAGCREADSTGEAVGSQAMAAKD
jgi:hypothetical protein